MTGGHDPGLPGPGQQAWLPGLRVDASTRAAEQELVALVLALAGLLGRLMRRHAICLAAQGELTAEQAAQAADMLARLEQRMSEIRGHFGLGPGDTRVDLGPLEPLLAGE
jgi:hypothetical protein